MENKVKQQIRLLRMVDECPPHDSITATREDPDWPFLMKWLRSGIIHGECGSGAEGDVFRGPSLSVDGRSLLSSLEAQTSVGIIKKNRFGFYKWFFSALGTAAIGYVVWLIQQ